MAMAQAGARRVVGVDFSARMVADAQQRAGTLGAANVAFCQGAAERTGLPSGCAVRRHRLPELRRTHANAEDLRDGLLARTGRSILPELDEPELAPLAQRVCDEVEQRPAGAPIREVDHWTMGVAQASGGVPTG